MKYEDTVMNPQQFADALGNALGKKQSKTVELILLEAQAEISFKAGKEQGYVEGCFGIIEETQKAHRAGIEEVVEWVEEQMLIVGYNMTTGQDIGMISRNQWQVFKKKRGIE